MNKQEWIKVTKKTKVELPYGTAVEIMYKNGSIADAKIEGNWFVVEPKNFDIDGYISGIDKYRIK